jgi:hypothetical protein
MENQHRQITGYRELDQGEIDQMNRIKAAGPILEALCTQVASNGGDPRWTAIGKTHLQEGLMALTRAIAQPEFF